MVHYFFTREKSVVLRYWSWMHDLMQNLVFLWRALLLLSVESFRWLSCTRDVRYVILNMMCCSWKQSSWFRTSCYPEHLNKSPSFTVLCKSRYIRLIRVNSSTQLSAAGWNHEICSTGYFAVMGASPSELVNLSATVTDRKYSSDCRTGLNLRNACCCNAF